MSVVGNIALQSEKEILEKSASEVIKRKDSNDHCAKRAHHGHGKNGSTWMLKQETHFLEAHQVR